MKKFISYRNLLMLLSVLLGIFYYYLVQVSVSDIKHAAKNANEFSFTLESHIDQEVKLHIATQRYKLSSVKCNDTQIIFPTKKMQWFEGVGEQVNIALKRGENSFIVTTNNYRKTYKPQIKQKISSLDYVVLFILLGIPIFHLIFTFFIFLLDKIKYTPLLNTLQNELKTTQKMHLLYIVLSLGILIRVLYFHKFGVTLFQHDWHGHIEFIKYIANSWMLPLPSKGLEYPQQPLYYLLAGGLYALLSNFSLTEKEILFGIGYISLFSSIVFLYYSYRFISLLTQSRWVKTVAMIFISLTPSIVYLSARINNDSLVMALSVFSLYYILKAYQSEFKTGFYMALLGVSLLFMTKISAASIELLFFILLITVYTRANQQIYSIDQDDIKKKLYLFGVVGIFLLGFTLWRVYLPIENTLHMVNSSAHYPNQIISSFGLSYFGTFNIASLLDVGYSHVYGSESIRYSFFTYQYGTMFFGEFDYAYFFKKHIYLIIVMKVILLFGLVYTVGFISYLFTIYKKPLIEKLLFATLLLNLLLIIKFMLSYPAVCNTDFRYFVPSFVLFSFIFANGLLYFKQIKLLWRVLNIMIGILFISEVLFFVILLT